jgi:hypothetical protein
VYEDHAPRAADFAIGLGDAFARAGAATGVTHLCCRVGLHSGPVVAGVLRAEKHRFQLFGDTVRPQQRRAFSDGWSVRLCVALSWPCHACVTLQQVNTASRMESTGEPRRVQCSATTAALLANTGRHTLTRRGMIDVKGKASMETFWLTARGRGKSAGRAGSHRSSSITGGAAAAAAAVAADLRADDVARQARAALASASAAAAAAPAAGDGSVRVATDETQ